MEPVAPFIMVVALVLVAGGLKLLRPLVGSLARLIDTTAEQRRQPLPSSEVAELKEALATLETRLHQVEERQEFTDQLLAGRSRGAASLPRSAAEPARGTAGHAGGG